MLKTGTFTAKKFRMLFIGGILGWIVCLLGEMGDSVIAGLYLCEEAVSAVELVSPIASVAYFVAILIACGSAIKYSTELGAFKKEESEKTAGMAMILAVAAGVTMALIMFFGKDSILGFYGCSEEVYQYASEYYDAYIWVALIYPIMWTLYYLISYDGDVVVTLTNDIVICVANVVLSLLWVGSRGIDGLALGTLASNVLGLLVLFAHFFVKSNSIRFRLHFSFKEILSIVELSSASSSTNLYIALIDIIFNKVIISLFGDPYLPAYTVVNAVMNFAAVLACSFGAGSAFVSIAYGEQNYSAIRRAMGLVNRYTVALGIGFSVLMIALASYWPDIYGITDPAVAAAAVYAGRIVPITYLAAGFVFTYLGYYPLTGHVFAGNLMGFSYMFLAPVCVALPLAYISFNAMTIGFALSPVFSLLILVLYCAVKKELKNAPLLLPATDEKEAHFDLALNTESILELRDKAEAFLKENGVDHIMINEIQMIIEDSLVQIQNKNNKKVICECVLLVNDEHVRLITKDNGLVFDITKDAEDAVNLRCYVLARMMESASEKSNTTTISFNRNTYIWER